MSPRAMCSRTASTPASYAVRDRPERKTHVAGVVVGVGRWPPVPASARSERACTSSRRRARRRPSPSSARPPSQACPVRRSQATTQSWRASRRSGSPWSSTAIDGRRSSACPRSYPRKPTSPPMNRGASAGTTDRPVEPADEPARDRERIRPGGGRLEHRDGVGGQVGPARVAAWPGALEQGQAGQVAERAPRRRSARVAGEAVGQSAEAQRRVVSWARDHRRDDTAGRRPRPPGSIRTMRTRDLGIIIGRGRPGPSQRHHGRRRRTGRAHDARQWRRPARARSRTGADRRHGRRPARRRPWSEPVFAGAHRLNGNGELTGLEWIRESGQLGADRGVDQHAQRRRGPRRADRRGGARRAERHVRSGRSRSSARRTTAVSTTSMGSTCRPEHVRQRDRRRGLGTRRGRRGRWRHRR